MWEPQCGNRDAQAIANSCWEGISVHNDLEHLDYTPAPMGSRRNRPINRNLSRTGFSSKVILAEAHTQKLKNAVHIDTVQRP